MFVVRYKRPMNPVGCWRDYSGNGNHAIQATAANQPTLQNGTGDTLNGHPMLRWDGSNDFLGTSMTVNLAPFTVFVVFNATNTGFIYEHNIASFTNGGSLIDRNRWNSFCDSTTRFHGIVAQLNFGMGKR